MPDFNTPGPGTWVATFTGPALIQCWGGGGGGAGGTPLSRGGAGGGGGALAFKIVNVVSGTSYSYVVGAGGSAGAYPNGAGGAGTASTFQTNVVVAAPGSGGNATVGGAPGGTTGSVGDSIIAGSAGSANDAYDGGAGGKGGGALGGAGGAGGTSPAGLHDGEPGVNPGGGGGGGYQASGGTGGTGGAGRVSITQASTVIPGFHKDSFTADGTYGWNAPADGQVFVEGYGSGGGGRGGVALGNGGAGGGGGAYSASTITVRKDVLYTAVVGNGGAGAPYNSSSSVDGQDTSLTLAAVSITHKNITSNVATLTVSTIHGFNVGDSVVVSGVDATFNGTYTVTAVNSTFTTFSYAKTAANTDASATGSANLASPTYILAKGGTRATGTTSGAGQGGQASAGIGTTKNNGFNGVTGQSTSQNGGAGGGGAFPNGGAGGYGGGTGSNPNAGGPGIAPGGGGGGGSALTGGAGGSGADGAVHISYFLTLGSEVQDGQPRYIVSIQHKTAAGVVHSDLKPYRIESGVKKYLGRVRPDLSVSLRAKPPYIPAGSEGLFDVTRGTFNYNTPNLDAALAAGYAEILIIGDSVAEGWTYLNNLPPFNFTADWHNAWPRIARNTIAEITGRPIGGTGMIRPTSVNNTHDPQWDPGSWGTSGNHYINSTSNSNHASFSSEYPGTAVAITTVGTGVAAVAIDGVAMGSTTPAVSGQTATRTVYTGLSNQTHVVDLVRTSGNVIVSGIDVYYPNVGIKVHDMAQGGSTASGTGQDAWADSSSGSPANMLPLYSQVTPQFGRAPHAVIIALGGNDLQAETPYATIKAAHQTIGEAFDTGATDIILIPDPHGSNTFIPDSYNVYKPMWQAIMELSVSKSWSYIDFDWLTLGYEGLAGQGYTGDVYGHLNTEGAKYVGRLFGRILAGQ